MTPLPSFWRKPHRPLRALALSWLLLLAGWLLHTEIQAQAGAPGDAAQPVAQATSDA